MGQETFEPEHNSGFRKKRYPGSGPERVELGLNSTRVVDLLNTQQPSVERSPVLPVVVSRLPETEQAGFINYAKSGGAIAVGRTVQF